MKKYILFILLLSGCVQRVSVLEKEKINIFSNRNDSIFSPSGSIDKEEVAFSSDGKFYLKELQPYNSGKIGIFLKNGEIFNVINTLKEDEKNDLKCITWHPNCIVIGVVYHKNNFSEILFYEIFKGNLLRKIIISGYYHYMVFDKEGRKIYISTDGEKIEEINLRNTDFVYNSGVNLPWINYGWDIGRNPWEKDKHGGFSSNKNVLTEKFKFFKNIGVNVVRVFLFCDLRSGVIFEDEKLYFDKYVFDDFKTLIDVAKENEIRILPVIFDYTIADGVNEENGIKVGEYPEIFNDKGIQRKIIKLFEDFFKKIDTKNIIYGWDIINEPEHLKIEKSKVEDFIPSFIKLIKKYRKNEKITIGSLSALHIHNYRKFNLDFYQFHYYDSFYNFSPLENHSYNLSFDKPVIIGEIESTEIINKLTKVWENGYSGVCFWLNDEFLNNGWKFYKAWVDIH